MPLASSRCGAISGLLDIPHEKCRTGDDALEVLAIGRLWRPERPWGCKARSRRRALGSWRRFPGGLRCRSPSATAVRNASSLSSVGQPNQAPSPLARSMTLSDGSSVSAPTQPVAKRFQPPSSIGFFDARRVTRVPQSLAATSTLSPSFFKRSAATSASAWMQTADRPRRGRRSSRPCSRLPRSASWPCRNRACRSARSSRHRSPSACRR